ncbi:hypothetical protein A8709_29385 [Paenibacillus pectinilyticus]|uniref:MPN domain-containing protein n=1 Tax=Paenibacillus pectinilyticus TaxID=512399 RepID=A0A1C0ZV42_9BACL|nr:Mov34/MPN/PAD-1 family protein [Paenibacillus pectinilyticus]OCT11976.1 hypothetical protein A8709_29385 [Paenibacillus pectinilyticus]
MIVHLNQRLYDEILSYSTRMLPYEACGILLGESDPTHEKHTYKEILRATNFIPFRNHAKDPTHQFLINPIDMLPYLSQTSHPIMGIFHSHPTAAPIPSAEDLRTLWHTVPTHWILSLQQPDKPDLQVYQLKKTTTTTYHKLSFVIGQ